MLNYGYLCNIAIDRKPKGVLYEISALITLTNPTGPIGLSAAGLRLLNPAVSR
jgi:hypothetical protein